MAFVYWIHLPEHTDIRTQGYVGITVNSYKNRFCAHKSMLSKNMHHNNHLQNAWNKYGEKSIVFKVICSCTDEYAYWLENNLRNDINIGWNIAQGGIATGKGRKQSAETIEKRCSKTRGRKNSIETIHKMSEAAKGKKKSEEHRKSLSKILRDAPPWRGRRANTQIWLMSEEIYLSVDINKTPWQASKDFNVPPDSFKTIFNNIKNGWNPLEDDEYQSWKIQKLEELRNVI